MTRLCDDLTRPEDSAERKQRRLIKARLDYHGGCYYCQHRDREVDIFGRSVCSVRRDQTYPKCMTDNRHPVFELDEVRLNEGEP